MGTIKQQRMAQNIREQLSIIFLRGLRDPRLEAVTVTDVQIDREFQSADIYINALGDEDRRVEVLEGLAAASGYLRRELARGLRTRSVPQLHFHWDPLLAHAEQINQLLDDLDIPPPPEDDGE